MRKAVVVGIRVKPPALFVIPLGSLVPRRVNVSRQVARDYKGKGTGSVVTVERKEAGWELVRG